MDYKTFLTVLVVFAGALILATCTPAAVPETVEATPSTTPTLTPTSAGSEETPAAAATPTAAQPPLAPPIQPLHAWSVAPDGAVFVVDAATVLHQLDPTDLSPVRQSPPLFEPTAETSLHLLAGSDQLFVGNEAVTQTLVLDRRDWDQAAVLDQAGSMALDPRQRLFLIPQGVEVPHYTGVVWAFDLADLNGAPQMIQTSRCISGPLTGDPVNRRLYVQIRNCINSPPHRRDIYAIYDLDTLALVGETEPKEPGRLDRPAIAAQAGLAQTVYGMANGNSYLIQYDLSGRELAGGAVWFDHYDFRPVVDAAGQWLYTIRRRGLAVHRLDDLTLHSFHPFSVAPPADIVLSPDETTLYLFGNDWLTALAVADLQTTGLLPVSPLPETWLQAATPSDQEQSVYVYPSPTIAQDGFALVSLPDPAEWYRTGDGGQSWTFLPALTALAPVPAFSAPALSLSPDFSRDQTIVGRAPWSAAILRSTDGGDTWSAWSPPLAFTTDRDGNREIYTMNQAGDDLRRLTAHPAADENAAWSPAWTRLAFQSERSGNWDIFSLDPACAEAECDLRQLTTDPGDDLLPAWSPDGRSLAFVSTRDGNPEIYLMDPDGQNQRRLTFDEHGDWRPAWLPDSQHLLFTSDRGGDNDLYQIAVPSPQTAPDASIEATPVITGAADDRDPAVSVNGTIFFLSDREGTLKTYTYGPSYLGGAPQLTPYPASDQSQMQAHPSPIDGDTLLVSLGQNDAADIYLIAPYKADVQLTTAPGFDGQPAAGPTWLQPDPAAGRAWLAALRPE